MFFLRKPTTERLREILADSQSLDYSYHEVGQTFTETPPAGYVVDHNRLCLGHGETVFHHAVEAMREWTMFQLGWLEPCWPEHSIEPGVHVGVAAKLGPVWSINISRIIDVIDEQTEDRCRFGYSYGTLPGHVERGEERFLIEWDREDDRVWYDLYAFSKPGILLTRIGYPLTRSLQKRFARDSKAAMHAAVQTKAAEPVPAFCQS